MLSQSRVQFYSEKIESCGRDQKTLFKVTKNLLGKTEEVVLPSSTSSNELAQTFSDFFIDKIDGIRKQISAETKIQTDVSHTTETEGSSNRFAEFAPVTQSEVRKIILASPCKSCELDPIPTWLLKECIDELLPSLTELINTCLEKAYVPMYFKSSLIRPHIKKPDLDANILKNYRPVSNLPFISKVLEKVIDVRLENYLSLNNLHEDHQSAYRKFHSTETALLKVQNDILNSLDQNDVTILVMLDLSAAFDTIDHKTLLNRLDQCFGIAGEPLELINSYLGDRYQTVTIDGKLSKPVLMKYSVPQGSVLGPKFFTMYTKPVGGICKKHGLSHHFYADDSQLYLSFKPTSVVSRAEAIRRVENCLKEIVTWMNENMLKLNADKTEVILFTSQNNEKHIDSITVKIGDADIKPSGYVRNLGAFLDSKMNMDKHINTICRSGYAQLRQIGHIRKYLNTDAAKSLVNSLVTSRLDYCNSLLSGVPKTMISRLQTLQNTAARIITRTSRYEHITPVLKELHWLPVNHRVEFKILVLTYKALHDQSPVYIRDMLEIYRPARNLRSKDTNQLVVPRTKTVKYGGRSFSAVAPRLWNDLPVSIRNSDSVPLFKKRLKTHMFINIYG